MSREIKRGDRVLLYQDARRKWVAKVEPGRFHTHRGYFELAELVGKEYGGSIRTSMGQDLAVFKPRALDIVESFDRPTQILYPKDIGYALFQLGIGNGDRVCEVGTGSGALTSALARGIAPDGQVFTYEMRPEFLRAARANMEKAGFGSLVTFHNKDPTEGFEEIGVDAVVVDLGDPWRMVGAAWRVLIGGGLLAGFTPTINQLEKLAVALREGGFMILEAVELLMREFKTEAGKVRPETRMIGHTAYVTIARKLLPASDLWIVYIRDHSTTRLVAGELPTGTKTTIAGTEIHDILRGIMVVIAGALIIMPAYINYELVHRLNLDITVSMATSILSFTLGILIFIIVVGKERIEGTKKP